MNIHVQSLTWVSAGTMMNSGEVSWKIVKNKWQNQYTSDEYACPITHLG